jgi:allantoin racemase
LNVKIFYLGTKTENLTPFVESSTVIEGEPFDNRIPHLEYEFYEHIAQHSIIEKIVEAEKEGYDAAVIGCFYDPALHVARELVDMPVIGVCEASFNIAAMISAGNFSVLIGRRKWLPKMVGNAKKYGFESRIASWRILNLTVPMMRDRKITSQAILRETNAAIVEDLAESVVIGCTGMIGGIPILDPVLCGIKVAEMRAVLWRKYNISHSKIGGYESPPLNEFKSIFEKIYSKTST